VLAEVAADAPLTGRTLPRIAPPRPLHSLGPEWHQQALDIGIEPFPWQDESAWYVYAIRPDGTWLYPEALELVGRQNGKTEKLVPHIVKRLRMGRRIMHTSQNRELPREVFGRVAEYIEKAHSDLLPQRRGRTLAPRFANGQEEIRLTNGGTYRIVAPTRGGARGFTWDDLIVDEVREFEDHDFISAAEPGGSASPNPQIYYLSSEGDEQSEVLNSIKARAGEDPNLVFLSWSAAPERTADDREGWCESNPSVGHIPTKLAALERLYLKHKLAGTLAIFETEYLTRPVITLRERLVDSFAFADCRSEPLGRPARPFMAVSMDPKGTRASAVLAWRLPDNSIGVRSLLEATGSPIDTDELGRDLVSLASAHGVAVVGGDPMTDAEIGKSFRKFTPISGAKFANASARFVLAVESRRLRWDDAQQVADDLTWTTRKAHDESGSYQAVRADDDRPITAALAAVRAVWLASNPVQGVARVW